jgi:hypothetical protein
MRFVRTIRGLRASLLALFVVAQVVGVTHLLYDHTLNVYETIPVGAHKHAYVKPTATSPDADHHLEIKSPLILQPGPAALSDGLDAILSALGRES